MSSSSNPLSSLSSSELSCSFESEDESFIMRTSRRRVPSSPLSPRTDQLGKRPALNIPAFATTPAKRQRLAASHDGQIQRGDTPLRSKYTPEQLFLMLKDYEYNGRLGSYGFKGPCTESEPPPTASTVASDQSSHGKASRHDIWSDEAEFVFLAAELYLPVSHSSAKTMFMQKACGRNEIIALIITLALGKYMTRKQVSSHLQVVRQRKKIHPEVKRLFDQPTDNGDGSASCDKGAPRLEGLDKRLYEIIGIPTRYNLSDIPRPDWVNEQERAHVASPSSEVRQHSGKNPVRHDSSSPLSRPVAKQPRVMNLPQTRMIVNGQGDPKLTDRKASQFDQGRKLTQPLNGQDETCQSVTAAPRDREFDELEDDAELGMSDIESTLSSCCIERPPSPLYSGKISLNSVSVTATPGVTLLKEVVQDMPTIKRRKVPNASVRWFDPPPHIDRTGLHDTLHVEVGLERKYLYNSTPSRQQLSFDLFFSVDGLGYSHDINFIQVIGKAGYLDKPLGKTAIPVTKCCIDGTRDGSGGGGSSSGRPLFGLARPYIHHRFFEWLAHCQAVETSVMPYYWVQQEITTGNSSLVLFYTIKFDDMCSLDVQRVVED